MSVAVAQPHRRSAPDPRDPRLGFPLGRLRLSGQITPEQYAAGVRYGQLALRHMRIVVGRSATLPPQPIERLPRGTGDDPSPEDVEAVRQAWEAAQLAIAGTRDAYSVNRALARLCVWARVEDWTPSQEETGRAREGLNALDRIWR